MVKITQQRSRGLNMNVRFINVLVMPLFLVMGIAQANTQSAEDIVKATADQVISRIADNRDVLDEHPEQIYGLINELVIPHFDFTSMSKWVLGKNWRQASDIQREKFVNEFRTLLVRTYARALLEYSDQQINYLPVESNPNSNLVVVKTNVQSTGSNAVPIDYRMHVSDGEWKVVDVAVDGISLVATYRGSFTSEIRKNGIDSLITKLTERNDTLVSAISN
jgi:phospholipid transport system substrate-binding protein